MNEKALEAAARAMCAYQKKAVEELGYDDGGLEWTDFKEEIEIVIAAYLEASGEARDAARWKCFLHKARVTQVSTTYGPTGREVVQTWSFTAPEGDHKHVNHAIDTTMQEGK